MNFEDVICYYATITNVKQVNFEDAICNYTTIPNVSISNINIIFSAN